EHTSEPPGGYIQGDRQDATGHRTGIGRASNGRRRTVEERPYTLLSCSVSLDGYLDSPAVPRLQLSNAADFERIDAVRASCDAILVGANTIRRDNPRLLIRSADRRRWREERGLPASPAK